MEKPASAGHVVLCMDQQASMNPTAGDVGMVVHTSCPDTNNCYRSQDMEKPAPASHVVLGIDQQASMNTTAGDKKTTQRRSSKGQTLRRLSFSKPKARFVEFNLPPNHKNVSDFTELQPLTSSHYDSSSDDYDSDEDNEEELEGEHGHGKHRKKKKRSVPWRLLVEWLLFIVILTCLVCSLTIPSLKHHLEWGLELWRWCLMVMVIFSGRLVSGWIVVLLVFLIERNFMLRERVLYFVYGLRKSFQNCVWLGLVLLSWTFMFNAKVHKKNKMLKKVFEALVAILIGATIWLVKIVLVKVLASSFHVATYFDRMKESVFHHYILDTLSGPPMDEVAFQEAHRRHQLGASKSQPASWPRMGISFSGSKKLGSGRIDIEKLKKLSMQSTTSAWNVKRLVNYVRSFGLSTISRTVDELGGAESEITSEWEARNCARRIFKNVAKPGAK